jgi:hypothetical protein
MIRSAAVLRKYVGFGLQYTLTRAEQQVRASTSETREMKQ